jgi:transmembrane protein EpsG
MAFASCFVAAILVALIFPFGVFLSYLLLLTVIANEGRPKRFLVAMLCVGAVVVLAPLIALKLPIQNGGNDKVQYLDFMYTMKSFGMAAYLARQPEVLSFSALYAASWLFGPSDLAFLVIFVVSFSLLLIVIWSKQYQVIPIFMILLMSSSSFFGTYGNLLRQAMAFPFLFMTIFSKSQGKAALCLILAGLTHLPVLIIGVPYLLYRKFGNRATWLIAGAVGGMLILPKVSPGLLSLLTVGDTPYISTKVNLYSTWENDSIAGVAALAVAIFILSHFMWWRARPVLDGEGVSTIHTARNCLVAVNFSFLALIATHDLTKVFERIYIYFFVIALMYLSLMIIHLRRGPLKGLVLIFGTAYGVYGFAKNLTIQPLLYHGDPIGYLTASLFEMYRYFM